MRSYESWSAARAAEIISAEMGREGPLLPILHGLLEAFGYVPEPAVPMVADALNLSRAEVHGVVTFYHDFRREPAGRHVIKLCRAEVMPSRRMRSPCRPLSSGRWALPSAGPRRMAG